MTIRIDHPADHVVELTIDRPPVNALDRDHQVELTAALRAADDDTDVRAVILTGAGRHFCAGADLREERALDRDDVGDLLGDIGRMLRAIGGHRVPVIAAVNGQAHGGGLEVALSCDLRLGSTTAAFGAAGVNIGLMANVAQLHDLVGPARARHMLLTGLAVRADQALAWGLVTELHEPDDLLPAARRLAGRIATRAPLAVEATKAAIAAHPDLDRRGATALQVETFSRLFRTEDHAEALTAFFEKRPGTYHRR